MAQQRHPRPERSGYRLRLRPAQDWFKTRIVSLGVGCVLATSLITPTHPAWAEQHAPAVGENELTFQRLETAAGVIEYTEVLHLEATAYYPGPESTGIWADGLTATGVRAGHGVVAVDPEFIPLGTVLYIPGYGLAVAADVGSAIKGARIDLCFDSYREAIQFGRRSVEVYVLTADWVEAVGRELFPAEAFAVRGDPGRHVGQGATK